MNSMYKNVTIFFGIIVCFLGLLLIWLVYYFWKMRNPSDLGYHPSVKLPQPGGEEKRKHPRADINWPADIETPDGRIEAELKNISLGGAFICCKKQLSIGETIQLTIRAPDNESVKATAKVVWSNFNVPNDKVVNRGMGVRFIKMSERHIQLVRQIFQKSNQS